MKTKKIAIIIIVATIIAGVIFGALYKIASRNEAGATPASIESIEVVEPTEAVEPEPDDESVSADKPSIVISQGEVEVVRKPISMWVEYDGEMMMPYDESKVKVTLEYEDGTEETFGLTDNELAYLESVTSRESLATGAAYTSFVFGFKTVPNLRAGFSLKE